LSINDRADLEIPCRREDLLKDDRPKEVGSVYLIWVRKHSVGGLFNVPPEGLPLVLLIPYVRALEKGNEQPLRHVED
jgi:hypothetical protein